MKTDSYIKMKNKVFIAVTALLLLTGFNAQAQQEDKPSYPGLSIQSSKKTPDAANTNRGRNERPTETDQGYNGVMAAPRAHTNRQNLRRFNQRRAQQKPSYAYSGGAAGSSGRATERRRVNNTPPEEEEDTAVVKPKPMEARFAASEQKLNLIKALREKRSQEKEKRRQEMDAKKKAAERRQQFQSSGSVALP